MSKNNKVCPLNNNGGHRTSIEVGELTPKPGNRIVNMDNGGLVLNRKNSTNTHQQKMNIITINVAGMRFQTFLDTLERFPNSLLGDASKRAPYFNSYTKEYFFDRHRCCFESILHIYQSGGQVNRPKNLNIDVFIEELNFFKMGDDVMGQFWVSEGYHKPTKVLMPENNWIRKVWQLVEYPDSSIFARIWAITSTIVILISIVSFCLETIPELKYNSTTVEGETPHIIESGNPFFWIEFSCIIWFSIELSVRFATCPNKLKFFKSFLNIVDFMAIAPFFVSLVFTDSGGHSAISRVLRLVRVLRIFKLSRHSRGLQILGMTFKSSARELLLLLFFMSIPLVLFASVMYFAEQNEPESKFISIPASFWYVIVTMTTVGYGDMFPTGVYGKLLGAVCALVGVLTLAMPIPIIVNNFSHFYRQEKRLAQMSKAVTGGSRMKMKTAAPTRYIDN